jgi:hypothetical protein
MASIHEHGDEDEPGREYDDELLADVSADERTADAPQDKDEERKRIRRAKNAKILNAGGTQKLVHETHLTATTLMVLSP